MSLITNGATAAQGATRPAPFRLTRVWSRVVLAAQVASERRALAAADPATLKDIGLERSDVVREAQRPVWDLPAGRR